MQVKSYYGVIGIVVVGLILYFGGTASRSPAVYSQSAQVASIKVASAHDVSQYITTKEKQFLAKEKVPAGISSTVSTTTSTSPFSKDAQVIHGRTYYPVVRVIDGDTLSIRKNGAIVVLRLIGLDTPETVDPRKPVQCFEIGRASCRERV